MTTTNTPSKATAAAPEAPSTKARASKATTAKTTAAKAASGKTSTAKTTKAAPAKATKAAPAKADAAPTDRQLKQALGQRVHDAVNAALTGLTADEKATVAKWLSYIPTPKAEVKA